ncbi:MAG: hypothetical protein EU532_08345 [Promethearchaeota archaeon]|nr:MAG: hypothetical protein EU532_08345 [Candidatus Lokiarchaeota archaeon]
MKNNLNKNLIKKNKIKSLSLSKKRNVNYKQNVKKFDNNKYVFRNQEDFDEFLKTLNRKTKRNIDKILVLGGNFLKDFENFLRIFPKSLFFITNISKPDLSLMEGTYKKHPNFKTYVLDAFDGASLLEFLLRHGKFDLIIASRLEIYSPTKKKLLHFFRFIYHHFLKKDGIFCMIFNDKELFLNSKEILKKKNPQMTHIINPKGEENSIHILFYIKEIDLQTQRE